MVYYSDEDVLIRTMAETDPPVICKEETAQGFHPAEEKYRGRLADQAAGKAVALVAEYGGRVAGYINVYIDSPWGSFANRGYCEIVDFGVLEKYRRRGIGARLMDTAERIASEYADTVYLGVGLHSGYGSAQRMYARRGYVPDGRGVWYGDAVAKPYITYRNDDDLVLYLSKKLDRRPL